MPRRKRGTNVSASKTKESSILIYDTGMVHAAQGKRAETLQIVKELEAMSGPSLSEAHWIAKIYATLNEKELAFSWLERGLAAGAIGAFYKDEPVWDTIRSDPRFADLLLATDNERAHRLLRNTSSRCHRSPGRGDLRRKPLE